MEAGEPEQDELAVLEKENVLVMEADWITRLENEIKCKIKLLPRQTASTSFLWLSGDQNARIVEPDLAAVAVACAFAQSGETKTFP